MTPTEADDSSAAAELRMVVLASKYIVAARTIQRDLDLGIAPTLPTPLFTDADAVIGGRQAERMPKKSRWMAIRYAMLRWAERSRTLRLEHIHTLDNCADIMTKCLTGAAFRRHRATVLGLPHQDDADAPGDLAAEAGVVSGEL